MEANRINGLTLRQLEQLPIPVAPQEKEFVLLQSIKTGDRFFSTNSEQDPTKSAAGETWYQVIGYADTVSGAQIKLYGRAFA